MSATTRERNGPYSTGLGYLLVGFGLVWIAISGMFVHSLLYPVGDYVSAQEPFAIVAFVALVLAVSTISSAVLIRWRPKTFPMPTRVPKAALVSVLLGGVLAGIIVHIELGADPYYGTDWRVVVGGLVVVAAAVSAVVLVLLRKRFFQTSRPT